VVGGCGDGGWVWGGGSAYLGRAGAARRATGRGSGSGAVVVVRRLGGPEALASFLRVVPSFPRAYENSSPWKWKMSVPHSDFSTPSRMSPAGRRSDGTSVGGVDQPVGPEGGGAVGQSVGVGRGKGGMHQLHGEF